jgi:hypothetical protein
MGTGVRRGARRDRRGWSYIIIGCCELAAGGDKWLLRSEGRCGGIGEWRNGEFCEWRVLYNWSKIVYLLGVVGRCGLVWWAMRWEGRWVVPEPLVVRWARWRPSGICPGCLPCCQDKFLCRIHGVHNRFFQGCRLYCHNKSMMHPCCLKKCSGNILFLFVKNVMAKISPSLSLMHRLWQVAEVGDEEEGMKTKSPRIQSSQPCKRLPCKRLPLIFFFLFNIRRF